MSILFICCVSKFSDFYKSNILISGNMSILYKRLRRVTDCQLPIQATCLDFGSQTFTNDHQRLSKSLRPKTRSTYGQFVNSEIIDTE